MSWRGPEITVFSGPFSAHLQIDNPEAYVNIDGDLAHPSQATVTHDIDLSSTSVVFNKGHQIRMDISSSNAPRFEPNPNTGGVLPPDPKEKPVVAHQTIFLGGPEGSYISLPQMVSGA